MPVDDVQLVRTREAVSRASHRLVNLREALDYCYKRQTHWRDIAFVRHMFMMRAALHGWDTLEYRWMILQEEAHVAADFERAQYAEIEQQLDMLELTLKCAQSDYEDLKDAYLLNEPKQFQVLEHKG